MTSKEKLITALEKFANSGVEILELWTDEYDNILCQKYPFEQDFQEVIQKIILWYDNIVETNNSVSNEAN